MLVDNNTIFFIRCICVNAINPKGVYILLTKTIYLFFQISRIHRTQYKVNVIKNIIYEQTHNV